MDHLKVYLRSVYSTPLARCDCSVTCTLHGSDELSYTAHRMGGHIDVHASSPLSGILAKRRLELAVGSNMLRSFFSLQSKGSLAGRGVFWFESLISVTISPGVTVGLPSCFVDDNTGDALLSFLLESGYSTLMLGSLEKTVSREIDVKRLRAFLDRLRRVGIEIAFIVDDEQADLSPLGKCTKVVPSRFYEKKESCDPSAREATDLEILIEEVSAFQEPCIYFFPRCESTRDAKTVIQAMKETPSNVQWLFSIDDTESFILTALAQERYVSDTAWMVMLNAGARGQGEGLWPELSLQEFEQWQEILAQSGNAGFVVHVAGIPRAASIIDARLLCLAQMRFCFVSVRQFFEAYAKTYGLDWDVEAFSQAHEAICVLKKVCAYKNNPEPEAARHIRILGQKVLCLIDVLEAEHPSKPLRVLSCDLRRILYTTLKNANIQLPALITPQDLKGGLWTRISGPARGFASVHTIEVRKNVSLAELDDEQKKIIRESYIVYGRP